MQSIESYNLSFSFTANKRNNLEVQRTSLEFSHIVKPKNNTIIKENNIEIQSTKKNPIELVLNQTEEFSILSSERKKSNKVINLPNDSKPIKIENKGNIRNLYIFDGKAPDFTANANYFKQLNASNKTINIDKSGSLKTNSDYRNIKNQSETSNNQNFSFENIFFNEGRLSYFTESKNNDLSYDMNESNSTFLKKTHNEVKKSDELIEKLSPKFQRVFE